MIVKFIELFAGIGGFRYGLEAVDQPRIPGRHNLRRVGATPDTSKRSRQQQRGKLFDCVYSSEWDKYASSIYRRHYDEIDTRDIRDVPSSEIPDHELLTGGFPCQAFSVAGKRGGFDDTRGTLFFEIARILRDKRPRHFLLENVKGLLSHESGQTFHTIIRVLTDLGYRVEWMVCNSKHFGVPQNRERVFIIGHLGDRCRGQVFPISGTDGKTLEELTIGAAEAERIYNPDGVSRTIKDGGGGGAKTGLYFVGGVGKPKRLDDGKKLSRNYNQGNRVYDSGGLANTLPAQPVGGKGGHTGLYAVKADLLTRNNPLRRLTPIECERLQGFPDNWTQHGIMDGEEVEISDTQRYKACGNAVTTNVITAIGNRLLEHIEDYL